MKSATNQIFTSILASSLLLAESAHSGDVTSVTSTFEGSAIPIGGSGTFQYSLTTSQPTSNATSITFESRFRFYTKFVASGGFAQLFRRNTDYSIGFEVSDPDQVGYRIKIQRRIIGISSINWTGPTGNNSSTGSVSYDNGLVRINGVLRTALQSGNFVSRVARETDPTPPDVSHRIDRFLTLSGYKGTQSFTISESEPAAQVVNVFQNHNTGSAELFFGLVPVLTFPDLTSYANSPDDGGDSFIVTVIFNPTCSVVSTSEDTATISFTGILQESDNLKDWIDISPQPSSPYVVTTSNGKRYFRSRTLE